MFCAVLVVWIVLGIHPADRANWLAESSLAFVLAPILYVLAARFGSSKFSITLITIYFILHSFGAHYNIGFVPLGDTIGKYLGTSRNEYDRLVHFFFGVLFFYPVKEVLLKTRVAVGTWASLSSFFIIMTASSLYEIMEWFGVRHLSPQAGYLFIGGTDPFDTQKDMAVAGVGALLMMALVALLQTAVIRRFAQKNGSTLQGLAQVAFKE